MTDVIKLDEIAMDIAMGPFGSNLKTDNFIDEGIPVIRGQNLSAFHVKDDGLVFVSDEKADSLGRANAYPGDIVITHRGTLGQVSMVPRNGRFNRYVVSQSQMRLAINEEIASPEYVTYWLRSELGQRALMAYATQTGVPALAQPTTSLKQLSMPLPAIPTQLRVVGVLGALDDKIAANRQVIEVGRSLLLAVWAGETESDKTRPLSEVIEINPKVATVKDETAAYVDMKALPEHGILVSDISTREPQGGARFENNDTVMARITPCFENGKMAFVDFLEEGEIGYGSTEYIVLRARVGVPAAVPFCITASDEFRAFAARSRTGTSGRQRVQVADLGDFPVSWPDADHLQAFEEFSTALLARMSAARNENQVLARTRDELLPLLMSGKITVRDAEKTVEAVL